VDRGCHVVSVTDPLRPYSQIYRPETNSLLSEDIRGTMKIIKAIANYDLETMVIVLLLFYHIYRLYTFTPVLKKTP
jgi:hypothetical protein